MTATHMVKPRGYDRGAIASTEVEHYCPETEAARWPVWRHPREHRPDVSLVRAASEPVRDEEHILAFCDRVTVQGRCDVDRDDACRCSN